jgi:uncharacterized membrane protein
MINYRRITERIVSVDLLRGWVMVVMALDHMRRYVGHPTPDPEDLTAASPELFFTRWVTYFCAPVFMYLAGLGAGLSVLRGRTRADMSHFLWTRGIWLIVLELTVIAFGWRFSIRAEDGLDLMLIWSLGLSMIVLSALIWLPKGWIAPIAVLMIVGHNLPGALNYQGPEWVSPLWVLLYKGGEFQMGSWLVRVQFSIFPWTGIMILGYVSGELYKLPQKNRVKFLLRAGLMALLVFLVLRIWNIYGDPVDWVPQKSGAYTILGILRLTSQPPSLLYLLLTMGPSIILLSYFEFLGGFLGKYLKTIGRVPLFFYILHIYLIHLIAVALGGLQRFSFSEMAVYYLHFPADYGFGLPVVYAAWFFLAAALYLPCRWFDRFKTNHPHPLISYL